MVSQGRRHGPSIMYKITPCWITLLQPARRAVVLGQLSSLRSHWLYLIADWWKLIYNSTVVRCAVQYTSNSFLIQDILRSGPDMRVFSITALCHTNTQLKQCKSDFKSVMWIRYDFFQIRILLFSWFRIRGSYMIFSYILTINFTFLFPSC
jgi:hypothetical protein